MLLTLCGVTAGGTLSLPDFVTLAKNNGFSGVEFGIGQAAHIAHERGFAALAEIFEGPKVLPAVFGLPVEWRKDEATFQAEMKTLPAFAKLAESIDCTRCTTWVLPDGGVPVSEYAATSTRRFGEIARVLNDQGVRLGIEFVGPQQFRPNPANAWFYNIPGALQVVADIEAQSGTQNVGLLVDAWHWYAGGGTAMDLASIPVEQVVHVHINDAPRGVARENLIDNERELPGATGEIDITAFLRTLAAIGVDGPVAVETFSAALNAMPPEQSAQLAGQSVQKVFAMAGIEPLRLQ